jgi:hypothetical protein
MLRRLPQVLSLLFVMTLFGTIASAQIGVGLLNYDQIITASDNEFDITNLTGTSAFPAFGYPITTPLTFTITSLVVNFTTGPSLTLAGSDFTEVDSFDDLDCTAAACNLFGDNITSATLTGTFSPTTGLSGLPAGDTGIEAGFTTTLTPSSGPTLVAGLDGTTINAIGTSGAPSLPEPGAWPLIFTLTGLVLIWRAVSWYWRRRVQGAAA